MALQARLNSEFTSHGFTAGAVVLASAERPDVLHARLMSEQFRIQDNETLLGIASESAAGIMARGAAGFVTNLKKQQERAAKRGKEQSDTAFFLTLLNNGELDSYIAGEIVDAMSDADVSALVADIEAQTGQSFEEYAQDILGDELPERMPWENDIDYQRRVIEAVADAVLEDDLSIKPGFENDPVARFVNGHETVQHAREMTAEADAIAQDQGIETAITHITPEIEESYTSSSVVETETTTAALSDVGYGSADEHSDNDFSADSTASFDTLSFAAGFPGSANALDAASANLESQFATASASPLGHEPQQTHSFEFNASPA